MPKLKAGIDLGGTKIEIIVLDESLEVYRKRISTPSNYTQILQAIVTLHQTAKSVLAVGSLPLGVGMPGALTDQGLLKNANTVCLNGQRFQADIESLLGHRVAVMNDANLFALSEAVDGAAAFGNSVFGVILGTGVGGGWVLNKTLLQGCNRIAGEWGHNPMSALAPFVTAQARPCYCGLNNCVETFLSGAGLRQTYKEFVGLHGDELSPSVEEIADLYQQGDVNAQQVLNVYARQAASALAAVINIVDPDIIVLGGGLSNLPNLAENIHKQLLPFVFSDSLKTLVVRNRHGDSSGVRGAAWLCD